MSTRRKLVQQWRSLTAYVRHGIYAGGAAVLAIFLAVVTDQRKGGMTGAIDYGRELILHKSCNWRAPHKMDSNTPVILLAGFFNDSQDEARMALESFLVAEADEFDTVLSCAHFVRNDSESLNLSREKFVNSLKPEIEAVNADLVLYGVVHPNLKVDLWSGNLLGGCDWQEKPTPVDLNATTGQEVLQTTRRVLLRVITTGLVAACQRQQDTDWQVVGRIFDIVGPYIKTQQIRSGGSI